VVGSGSRCTPALLPGLSAGKGSGALSAVLTVL